MFSTTDLEKMSISDLKVTGKPQMCGDVWWLFPFVLQAIMERLAVKGAASDEKAHGFMDSLTAQTILGHVTW